MTELSSMWRNTRMVVLSAIAASLYAAVLVPFKVIPLIPGVTELRPANAIPIVCSFLFGPAAAWGSAIGNMIGDFFGGIGPGDFFGFWANLMYGYLPYKVWNALSADDTPINRSPRGIVTYLISCMVASTLCADVVGWGENLIGLRPFAVFGNVIIFNNMIAATALSPFLLAAIYPRVKSARLLYQDVMPELPRRSRQIRLIGLLLLVLGEFGAWAAGNLISTGYWAPHFLPARMVHAPYAAPIGIVVTPLMLMATIGVALL